MQNNTRYYRIGGLVWALSGPNFEESDRLSIFRCEPKQADIYVQVSLTEEPRLPELPLVHHEVFHDYFSQGETKARAIYLENDGRVLLTETGDASSLRRVEYARFGLPYYGSKMALRILDMPRRVLHHGGVFLHASYIEVDGRAILFTAPKQTGKSTQAELWRRYRGAKVVNGDRALLRRQDGIWHAHGSPYCGTSDITYNVTCPVQAIVILGQAKENTVRAARPRETLSALLNGFTYDTWDSDQTRQALALAEDIIRDVPVLKMDCLPDESAVQALEEVLWRTKNQ